jgi:transcription elongation factor GreA
MGQHEGDLPLQSPQGKIRFFESFFVVMNSLENQPFQKELLKKTYQILSTKRYALVRELLQHTDLETAKELLLLASKCQTLTGHDMKILRSLTEVVHPSIAPPKKRREEDDVEGNHEIWTTEEGYRKTQERIQQIGTIEMVENAREIEAARALGDLRENSEYKFAQERRARLQTELKSLSSQLNRARIITPDDIAPNEVGVGNIIELVADNGNQIRYTILGPWDADPDRNILSLNSKFAQAMVGRKTGESFEFKEGKYKILSIGSFLKK